MLQCTIAIEPQEIRYANNRRRLVASSPTEQDEWELAFEYGRPVRSAWAARRHATRSAHVSRDPLVQADAAAFVSAFMRIG